MKDLRPHSTVPAILSLIILSVLLGFGLWLLLRNDVSADQAVITTQEPNVVAATPTAAPTASPSPTLQ